jgi:hypothetical protein
MSIPYITPLHDKLMITLMVFTALNMVCLGFTNRDIAIGRWFENMIRRFDGHSVGNWLKAYAVIYLIACCVNLYFCWGKIIPNFDFTQTKAAAIFLMPFAILPYWVGRKIVSGDKSIL